ncbi:hypothetical protein QE152_g15632 [Popillia japonica]|uniref:Uncharacterized protein n=1 Tax=Popillia japonica TaxID=7064 RepID=A0AAW1L785_POPJA
MNFELIGGLTLEEALHMAYDENLDVGQIYIEPPDAGTVTDEDSGEEDGGELIDNLYSNQLNTNVQLYVKGLHNNNDSNVEEGVEEVEKVHYSNIEWVKGDLVEGSQNCFNSDYEMFKTLSPTEMFELFIDKDVVGLLVQESNRYAQYRNFPNPQII